jgi:5-enolpyruvylshikimate-3-phosphate synthase
MEIEPASHEIDAVSIQTASIRTYHDHRIAMAFAVLSSGLCRPLRIENPEVVSKSWPTFWDELDRWCTGGRGRPSSGGG